MSDKVRISAVVQTYNAEKHLEKCLKALEPFDEILVVDMESTDATRDIAGRVGARVVVKERGEHRMVEAYRDLPYMRLCTTGCLWSMPTRLCPVLLPNIFMPKSNATPRRELL